MKVCPQCGQHYGESKGFCRKDGAALIPDVQGQRKNRRNKIVLVILSIVALIVAAGILLMLFYGSYYGAMSRELGK